MTDTLNNETFYGLILALAAFFLATFLTPVYTYFAYKYKFWKKQKKETLTGEALPVMTKLHAKKFARAFPTMAGVIGVVTVFAVTGICNLNREQTWLPLVGFIGGSLVGLIDDLINVFGSGKGAAGLRAPVKFAMITAIGVFLGWWFAVKLGWTSIEIPFMGAMEIGPVLMIILFAFAVVATSNAVNISDGLDGLAGGLAMLAYGAYGVIALLQGQWMLTGFCLTVVGWLLSYIWFNVPPARFMMGDTGSFAIGAGLGVVAMMTNAFFLLPIIGVIFVVEAGSSLLQIFWKKVFKKKLLSYIWFNVPPARFMMGDTGSFAIGAGLGVVAMMTNAFFLLPIIGVIFVVEAGSSLLQIFWKKVFKKKLLISAPIHHHLEAKGWGEAKIVMRFWVIAGVFAIIGIFLAVQGGIV